jgi:hypothetical protein
MTRSFHDGRNLTRSFQTKNIHNLGTDTLMLIIIPSSISILADMILGGVMIQAINFFADKVISLVIAKKPLMIT